MRSSDSDGTSEPLGTHRSLGKQQQKETCSDDGNPSGQPAIPAKRPSSGSSDNAAYGVEWVRFLCSLSHVLTVDVLRIDAEASQEADLRRLFLAGITGALVGPCRSNESAGHAGKRLNIYRWNFLTSATLCMWLLGHPFGFFFKCFRIVSKKRSSSTSQIASGVGTFAQQDTFETIWPNLQFG
ncbi:hypothetical protein GC207_15815 [bacterium]|nr:hypothetical protein [bacterium]